MAKNFRVFLQQKRDILHMDLKGDFDGTSAFELLNILKKNCRNVNNVLINTSRLENIFSFGTDILSKNFSELYGLSLQIQFVGKNVGKVYPEKNISF